MKKICLFITFILSCANAIPAFSQACTPDTCTGTTGYRDAPISTTNINSGGMTLPANTNLNVMVEAGYSHYEAILACRKAVIDQYGAMCTKQIDQYHQADILHCNNLVVGGAAVGGVGGVVLGVVSLFAGPPGWVVGISVLVGGTAAVGGVTVGAYGSSSCLTTADIVYKTNVDTCSGNVTKLQNKYCI